MSEKKIKDVMNEIYEKTTVNGSHGVYVGDAEYVKQLESKLKDAEKVILTCDSIFESDIDKQKAINEYIEKYNIPKGV